MQNSPLLGTKHICSDYQIVELQLRIKIRLSQNGFMKSLIFQKMTRIIWGISALCTNVHIFGEGHKILQNLHLTFDWHYIGQKKVWWRFRKILWPSQNIWTLLHNYMENVFASKNTSGSKKLFSDLSSLDLKNVWILLVIFFFICWCMVQHA